MSAQDALNAWGRKKYPLWVDRGDFRIDFDYDEGCPTCGGGGIEVRVYCGENYLEDLYGASFGGLLAEILAASA